MTPSKPPASLGNVGSDQIWQRLVQSHKGGIFDPKQWLWVIRESSVIDGATGRRRESLSLCLQYSDGATQHEFPLAGGVSATVIQKASRFVHDTFGPVALRVSLSLPFMEKCFSGEPQKTSGSQEGLNLTKEEATGIYEIICQLSGWNPENVFAWDGTDSLDHTVTRATAKLYKAVGKPVPKSCR
jgi:hypothetical protein